MVEKRNLKSGFTLIEMIVVVGVLAVLMAAIVGIMLNWFRVTRRVDINQKVEESGTIALEALRQNILTADPVALRNEGCLGTLGVGLTVVNRYDSGVSNLVCNENGQIASSSANSANYLKSGIMASGCGQFVSCDVSGDTIVVSIKFGLSGGSSGVVDQYSSKTFSDKITVRE
jgi:prepilin-type N-terminal cleavage/methylation domain-containing protein